MHARRPVLAVVAHAETATTIGLVRACNRLGADVRLIPPEDALAQLRPGDTALGRLDVRPALDGIEPGLWELRVLERESVTVLNRASALVAAHDKLHTAARLAEVGLPHPETVHVDFDSASVRLEPPLVLKPRFGSGGRDVVRCDDAAAAVRELAALASRPWFRATGAVAQSLVPPTGRDLRIVVARGGMIGAIERVAAPGEWRTNISAGGARRAVQPPPEACALALAAVAAIGADLAGVDLLRRPDRTWTVLEINGAVDFTRQYRRPGDVFEAAAAALLESPDRLHSLTTP